jgi:hypothetical protein
MGAFIVAKSTTRPTSARCSGARRQSRWGKPLPKGARPSGNQDPLRALGGGHSGTAFRAGRGGSALVPPLPARQHAGARAPLPPLGHRRLAAARRQRPRQPRCVQRARRPAGAAPRRLPPGREGHGRRGQPRHRQAASPARHPAPEPDVAARPTQAAASAWHPAAFARTLTTFVLPKRVYVAKTREPLGNAMTTRFVQLGSRRPPAWTNRTDFN